MKGFLHSQDGSYAFPLGPKVTTIGRENCDISINNPHVDNQHALMEYDDEQRCFILKDLNSSTGTYVHDCRVQNAAVRLADGDLIRFGFHGLPLEFRIEQHESSMPSIYQRQPPSNSLQLINQTIPSRRITSGTITHQKQIDVQQNPGFSLRTRPSSAGIKKPPTIPTNQTSNAVRTNAWTISSTINPSRSLANGDFEMPPQDTDDIANRVDQLEKEVKGRDTEIRQLNDRLRSLEPLNSTFTNEVHTIRSELEKVKREKQAAAGLISSLQRDLHTKESDLAKITRELEALKNDTRDKDVRLQSLQAKLNLLRDRGHSEEDRYTKEKELVNLRNKIKLAEQQISELTESVNRLKSQLQDTEKQLLRFNQNEQKLKQECEQARAQLAEVQSKETKAQTERANLQKKYDDLCTNIWKCFATDEDDEFDEDEHNLAEKVRQLREECSQSKTHFENQRQTNSSLNEKFEKLRDLLTNVMQEQTTAENLSQAREQILQIEDNSFLGLFKQAALRVIDHLTRTLADVNNLINQQNLSFNESWSFIRNQHKDFQREKAEQTSREQRFQSEIEKITAEKDAFWQQRFNEECDRLRQENAQLQRESDEQIRTLTEQIDRTNSQQNDHLRQLSTTQTESREKIEDLTAKLQAYQRELTEQKEQFEQLSEINEKQTEEIRRLEKDKNSNVNDLNRQIEIYKDQVQQFSKTIIELEKNLHEEQHKRLKLQTDFEAISQNGKAIDRTPHPPPPVAVETVIPIIAAPVVDFSQEFFAYKSRVHEQEQIIVSLRRDLAGMTARLSDVQGELSEKQKRTLEKSEFTIREQTKELNDTRLKLSKLSEIVDKQSTQIESLQTDLSKSKTLANQYQLLVDQRQADIDRLSRSLEQQNLTVEKTTQNEGRITHELVAIGAQCKGEKHEQTIGRQREALNELRARIKSLEQLRPANPSYEKVFQQVVLLKRELAELRAKHALPTDISYLSTSATNSFYQQSTNSLNGDSSSVDGHKVLQERTAHAETMNTLQSCDDLYNSFTRKLVHLLDVEDETLLNISPLANLPTTDRYVAIQQRQKIVEVLLQKIEILHERLSRKEDLLRDYEKDLGKLRQAELLLREKDLLLQDLEIDKRSKDDEALYLRNTIKETQQNLNQEKRLNSVMKTRQNIEQPQSNDLVRRSGPVQQPPIRLTKRDVNQKASRKDYEIKTLKQELHEALDTLAEQSNKVKLLEIQSKDLSTNTNYFSHDS